MHTCKSTHKVAGNPTDLALALDQRLAVSVVESDRMLISLVACNVYVQSISEGR